MPSWGVGETCTQTCALPQEPAWFASWRSRGRGKVGRSSRVGKVRILAVCLPFPPPCSLNGWDFGVSSLWLIYPPGWAREGPRRQLRNGSPDKAEKGFQMRAHISCLKSLLCKGAGSCCLRGSREVGTEVQGRGWCRPSCGL